MRGLGDWTGAVTAGTGTTGLATAAVAALSASALAGLVWMGADQLATTTHGHPGGAAGDLGLAPAQVDLGHPPAIRVATRPAQPLRTAAPVTAATAGSGAGLPLAPVQPDIPPPSAGGSGSPEQPVGPGNPGGGPSTLPAMHVRHGNRWAVQLAVSLRDGLAEVAANVASLEVPGTGTLPSGDSPRSAQARAAAENRVIWALVRADRKGMLPGSSAATGDTAGSTSGQGKHRAATAATNGPTTTTSDPSGATTDPAATPTGQPSGHDSGPGPAQGSGQGQDKGGHGGGSGHDGSSYHGKHRKG